jgi:hypothetical protein
MQWSDSEARMSNMIQAVLDAKTESIRKRLQNQLGWTDSQVVREGITALSPLVKTKGKRKIIGQGKFNSGVPDLATNRGHLDDYAT